MKSIIKHLGITLFLFNTVLGFTQIGPVIKDGEAQVVEEFADMSNWIRHDLWVETEFDTDGDGQLDRMHVSVTRPGQTDSTDLKLPVVYASSPYYSGVQADPPGIFWNVRHQLGEDAEPRVLTEVVRKGERPIISNSEIEKWVPRGYIVVHSSSPGTGLSDGVPTVGGDNESLAPKAVVEWLAGKDNGYSDRVGGEKVYAFWSNGNVGMTGTSYNGTLPLAAATTGVDGLKAIIPIAPNTSYYHYYRSYGLVRSPGGYLGEDIDVLFDFIYSGDESKRAYGRATVRDKEMAEGMDRKTGDYNEFWAGRDYLNDLEPMKAALFMAHGFNDWNVMPEHSYRIYEAAKKMGIPHMIYYHQDGHGGPPPFSLMNKWFTRYLHGVNNGVDTLPKAWIVREGDDQDNPTAYEDYPHPDAEDVTLYLNPGAPAAGELTLEHYSSDIQKETFEDNFSFDGASLAKAEITDHRLLYLSPILREDLHLSGEASITISLASSKEATNLSVWLVSLPWNEGSQAKITDNIITRGWADPQNYKSISESEPLVPGQFYDFSFKLQPDDQIISSGQQVALMIFGSDREFTLWPDPGTEVTIDLSKTKLKLPIVGGESTYRAAIE
ncbi:Xaa-Pro dipeptidyl-peptidase [Portibacter marinus]|uniref:Xaa-Pro dipeptidyl-peptidase n=1 Tax=Portibacter marinus TaxID=2898660 RepID=UPI001F428F7C|nr:Xaa-Pro dipeptidyl-peptidase [Portibacter marinus]